MPLNDNESNLFYRGHLGMGDHIICNGLFRVLHEKYDSSTMPVKAHNVDNVKHMFSDLPNVEILPVVDDDEADVHLNNYKSLNYDIVRVGFFGENFNLDIWDESFYNQAGINYDERWNKFYCSIDEKKELELYSSLGSETEYIFVHDDASRGMPINKNLLPDIEVVRPCHTFGESSSYTIFDYGRILHNAREIHCIDSSFACWIDHVESLKDKPKYIHRYIRSAGGPTYRNNWRIINESN